MAATTLLATQSRGNFTSPAFSVPAGPPKFVRIALVSPTFATDPTLVWNLLVEQSFDGGVNWVNWFTSDNAGGFGLAVQNATFDGVARQLRATATVPIPFVWGLTAEILVL